MLADRSRIEEHEASCLAPYAALSSRSRGRRHPEEPHPYRTEFQRDRERIIHSRAFRRLEYKTQVFVNHEGDHYRTRLTHTIEVAQIARSIARALRLNEDLAESVSLAHDLGHTPFGHAGERELSVLLRDEGGFEHNRQSLRVVDHLEKRYAAFDGLNLTWETREGIIKHSTPYDHPDAAGFDPREQPSLEAQIIDLADEIAYNNHDLDDGLSSGILPYEEVRDLDIWKLAVGASPGGLPSSKKEITMEMIRRIINLLASDLIENTRARLQELAIETPDDVKTNPARIPCFSTRVDLANGELKRYLSARLYRNYRVTRMTYKAEKVIRELFTIYTQNPGTMPDDYQHRIQAEGLSRVATDYIAGMTDRFALEEHRKLTDPMVRA